MKSKLLFAIGLFLFFNASAKNIELATAMNVAKSFCAQKTSANRSMTSPNVNLSLVSDYKSITTTDDGSRKEESLYYIFNINASDGFIIVSGDDVAVPVLAYSTSGSFHTDHLPPAFQKWMESYKKQLLFAKATMATPAYAIKASWDELLEPSYGSAYRQLASSAVSQLLSTEWDQEPYYNDLCPYDVDAPLNNHVPTGCVATAMAQIMKYWGYPSKGTGFHSYYSDNYGSLSADFGNTTYNWAGMPAYLNGSNTAIATLMYQCGVSVDMQYAPDGSGSYVITADDPICAQSAYSTYFGYDANSMQGLRRDDINNIITWKNYIKTELNAARPVQYVGVGSGGGHTWVCDGYDANDYFHMNWGWGGDGPNAYYALDALNPPALGAGGGDGGFYYGQEILIGIQPPTTSVSDSIVMMSEITASSNPVFCINYPFLLNVTVKNAGTSSFQGNVSAAIFKLTGEFVKYVEVQPKVSSPIAAGGITTLHFTSDGSFISPGTYLLGVYYIHNGGGWKLMTLNGHSNPATLGVVGPSAYIRLYSNISASPTIFTAGAPATVTVNVENISATTFKGTYIAYLFDLQGNFEQVLDNIIDNTGLAAGAHYSSPLTFSCDDVTVAPGNHVLGVFYLPKDSVANGSLPAGSQLYFNPVNIQVVSGALSPDQYESNNDSISSFSLPDAFASNISHPNTSGSNLHIGSDIDYYKVVLPAGYTYTIKARVNDAYSSDDANAYSGDVLWTYNTGNGWSNTFDDSDPNNIVLVGGHTVYFKVANFIAGGTGTYLFKADITRTPLTGLNEVTTGQQLLLYPNPASSLIHINTSVDRSIKEYHIFNSLGQSVMNVRAVSSLAVQSLDLSAMPAGVYYLEAIADKERYSARFIISR